MWQCEFLGNRLRGRVNHKWIDCVRLPGVVSMGEGWWKNVKSEGIRGTQVNESFCMVHGNWKYVL